MCAAAALVSAKTQYILVTPHNFDFLDNETSQKHFWRNEKNGQRDEILDLRSQH
jgi:hypothetical protein